MQFWQTAQAFAQGFWDYMRHGWAMPTSTKHERAYQYGYSLAYHLTGGI